MEKNEVYDYLAKIYLDKQPKGLEKKGFSLSWKSALFLTAVIVLGLVFYFFYRYPVKPIKPGARSLYIAAGNQLIKINYNFSNSSLKKENYSLEFPDLDLRNFSLLRFQARHSKRYGLVNLRVEIENNFKEISACYVSGLTDKWKEFELNLSAFKEISQWQTIRSISFIVEEWNAANKEDSVFIDAIRFSRLEK